MKKTFQFLSATYSHWQSRKATRMGAALSYYTIFSLAPVLVILFSLTTFFFTETQIMTAIANILSESVGPETTTYILSFAGSIDISQISIISGAISIGLLILTAVGVLSELNNDLDELMPYPENDTVEHSAFQKIKMSLRQKVAAFSIVPIGTILLIFSVTMSILLARVPGFALLANLISFMLSVVLFALIFKILPNTKPPWREVFLGGFITAILFFIGKLFIEYYINTIAGLSIYGAAGSLIAVMLWVYYSAQIFFLSASCMYIYSKQYGFLSTPPCPPTEST